MAGSSVVESSFPTPNMSSGYFRMTVLFGRIPYTTKSKRRAFFDGGDISGARVVAGDDGEGVNVVPDDFP